MEGDREYFPSAEEMSSKQGKSMEVAYLQTSYQVAFLPQQPPLNINNPVMTVVAAPPTVSPTTMKKLLLLSHTTTTRRPPFPLIAAEDSSNPGSYTGASGAAAVVNPTKYSSEGAPEQPKRHFIFKVAKKGKWIRSQQGQQQHHHHLASLSSPLKAIFRARKHITVPSRFSSSADIQRDSTQSCTTGGSWVSNNNAKILQFDPQRPIFREYSDLVWTPDGEPVVIFTGSTLASDHGIDDDDEDDHQQQHQHEEEEEKEEKKQQEERPDAEVFICKVCRCGKMEEVVVPALITLDHPDDGLMSCLTDDCPTDEYSMKLYERNSDPNDYELPIHVRVINTGESSVSEVTEEVYPFDVPRSLLNDNDTDNNDNDDRTDVFGCWSIAPCVQEEPLIKQLTAEHYFVNDNYSVDTGLVSI